ncbi:MAG: hypothetical protein GXP31_14650 [Kiritimatiellaeota bacterium]|nr:hypothetical protein [Kiritimatiellota bacterium]
METIVCPYCECRVKISDVDNEGGACPECGAMITGSLIFGANRLGFEEDEFDEDVPAPGVDEEEGFDEDE